MDQPPRRIGKRLIGRFLLLRLGIATSTLIIVIIGSVFWVKNMDYGLEEQRAQALTTLNFGAIALTMSARFSRKSAFNMRSFHGNQLAWYSYTTMAVLQVFIIYTPGLNTTIFQQTAMDGIQWAISLLFTVVVFIVVETEKAVRNYLTELKYDTDDVEYDGLFDSAPEPDTVHLPSEVRRFGHNELRS